MAFIMLCFDAWGISAWAVLLGHPNNYSLTASCDKNAQHKFSNHEKINT
jgi:hypothetical protein